MENKNNIPKWKPSPLDLEDRSMNDKYEAIELQWGGSIQEVLDFCEGKAFVEKGTQDIYYQTDVETIEKVELGATLLKNKHTGNITILDNSKEEEKYRIDLYTRDSKITILHRMKPNEFKFVSDIQDRLNDIPDNTYLAIDVRKVDE